MLRASWKSLLARKLRLVMSAFAIVLGVAFVAGSLVFTDTLGRAFTSIVAGSVGDVVVRPVGGGMGEMTRSSKTLPAELVASLAKVEGARRADGNVTAAGVFVIGRDGKLVGGGGGAPGLGASYHDAPAGHGLPGLTIREGRAPATSGEIALDPRTAEAAGFQIGDSVRVVTPGGQPEVRATLVGIGAFGGGSLAGATLTLFDTRTAQQLFTDGKQAFSDAWVTADDGVSQAQLRDRVAPLLPTGVEAVTGDKVADEAATNISEMLGFIRTFLLIFAGVSLVVGSFLIVNTFSIIVAQRSRELALLRALGASRRQVRRSVLFEALVVGLIGSTLGLVFGFALAIGIKALFAALGLDLSDAPLVFSPRTAVAAYAVGLVVTAIAAWLPARRASRVAPVEAMRDDVTIAESSMSRRVAIGVVMAVAGGAAMGAALFADILQDDTPLLGGGILFVLLGVSLASPLLSLPVIGVTGWVYRRSFGTVGLLAQQNARRNPRRTAATASALMIGLTLVSMMAVFGQSTKDSIDKVIGQSVVADYVVSNTVGLPFSPAIADQIRDVPGVAAAAQLRYADVKIDGRTDYLGALDPEDMDRAMRLQIPSGSTKDLVGDTILVEQGRASAAGLRIGDRLRIEVFGQPRSMRVVGTFVSSPVMNSTLITNLAALQRAGTVPADAAVFVVRETGADATAVRAGLDAVVADLPTVSLKDQAEFAEEQRSGIDQALVIIYALLGLAIIIAVLGIINTLALAVIERTREVGLLRAVGLSRRQLRRMVRLEAVIIALLGGLLGIGLGVLFGVSFQQSQKDAGIEILAIPIGQLVLFAVLAVLVGLLASLWPAHRAARLDVLQAITTE